MTDVLSAGVIGTGRIGSVLLQAAAQHAPFARLLVAGRNRERCEALKQEIPSLTVAEVEEVAHCADLLILALPPEAYVPMLGRLAPQLRPAAVVVSITNGIALEALRAIVPNPVVKVIPTMAHTAGRGVAPIVAEPRLSQDQCDTLHRFFSAFSRPILIDDRDSRVASNVAGSALALIASFCEAFVEANAARAVTLDRAELTAMMAETLGAVSALVQHGYGFAEIVRDTATPGGATEAALGAASTLAASDIVEATFRWQATMQDRMKYPEAG